jgi:superfamily I DNA and/or RNA helicase
MSLHACSRMLNIQYRMNQMISDWSSIEMYNGNLKSHESNAHHTIADLLPNYNCDEYATPTLLLIDTSGCEGMGEESNSKGSHRNLGEAQVVKNHVTQLIDMGVKLGHIGIITPYNGQLEVIQSLFELEREQGLEIRTVDGFQVLRVRYNLFFYNLISREAKKKLL